jgi:CRISPR-associated protein (TIGR02584 family)
MQKHSHEFSRRVLAMAVGLTPQVVTETLYALTQQCKPAWVPTEVWVLTTAEGALRARLTLLDPSIGQFHQFCTDYGLTGQIRFDEHQVRAIESPNGPLQDIRTRSENAQAADALTAFVRNFCEDPDAAVHVSIAGGRKSMGYYLGYALSLFGRQQDRLSHVLVNEPFQSINDFYFPPASPKVVFAQGNRPASTADAVIDLAEIPFVRLREGLPAALFSGQAGFTETVETASLFLGPPFVKLLTEECEVVAGGVSLKFAPLLWAWYATLLHAKVQGEGHDGWIRYCDIRPKVLLNYYALVAGTMSATWMQLEKQLLREQGVSETFFREKNAKVNRALRQALGPRAASYLITGQGQRPLTRYGVTINPDQVDLPRSG